MNSRPHDLQDLAVSSLLDLYSRIVEELHHRKVTRSTNNPVADYAEYLCEKALNLTRADNSTKGYDATNSKGLRYQIKGRRLTRHSNVRQLGALRDLNDDPFDYLIGVLFRENFQVMKACLLPIEQVRIHSEYISRTNSSRFILRDSVWSLPGAKDITANLFAVQVDNSDHLYGEPTLEARTRGEIAMTQFDKRGQNIRELAKSLILEFMQATAECQPGQEGMKQAHIFRLCGLIGENYPKATSSSQQYWILSILKELEKEGRLEQVSTSGPWRLL